MAQKSLWEFVQPTQPKLESYWRGIILFGDNTASYKFALSLALLELGSQGKERITLEELALPYARHLANHLQSGRKQTTSPTSRFLDGVSQFNRGEISLTNLVELTTRIGFNNVIDAFHNLSGIDVPRFYLDERKSTQSIRLTDSFFQLLAAQQASNLPQETESRWNLVETAWHLKVSSSLLTVRYNEIGQELYVEDKGLRRTNITSARHALSGYQKGKCFYCFRNIFTQDQDVHVDHVFPHSLKPFFRSPDANFSFDGVWNLVLACPSCNLAKSAQRPHQRYVVRLYKRNEFYIGSHHPLRETLIQQTGDKPELRQRFLQSLFNEMGDLGRSHHWQAPEELEEAF